MNKKTIYIILAVVAVGLIWSAVSAWTTRKAVEQIVETQTGGDVDYNADGTVNYTSDDGTFSTVNKLPDQWPKDAEQYPGATIIYSGYFNANEENSQAGASATLQTKDKAEDVMNFYKSNLEKEGWALESEANVNGGYILSATKEERTYSISISPSDEETTIIVGISE